GERLRRSMKNDHLLRCSVVHLCGVARATPPRSLPSPCIWSFLIDLLVDERPATSAHVEPRAVARDDDAVPVDHADFLIADPQAGRRHGAARLVERARERRRQREILRARRIGGQNRDLERPRVVVVHGERVAGAELALGLRAAAAEATAAGLVADAEARRRDADGRRQLQDQIDGRDRRRGDGGGRRARRLHGIRIAVTTAAAAARNEEGDRREDAEAAHAYRSSYSGSMRNTRPIGPSTT